MTVVRRRLFWKIYLTLLASLVAVVLFMGACWWLLGETQRERWGAPHVRLSGGTGPGHGVQPKAADGSRRDGIGADVSIYDGDGTLIASNGLPVAAPLDDSEAPRERRRVMRIDLPDGRVVLARLRLPAGRPGAGILVVMLVVAGAVGLAAWPVTARLTRRLEGLRGGMTRWGQGELSARAEETGSDEVALVARTFNVAAERVDSLLASQRALLANASHELRSPLARLRVAIELWSQNPATTRAEVVRSLDEIDGLVEEILLSSRLDHPGSRLGRTEAVDLLGLAAEEAVHVGAIVLGEPVEVLGDARLLRRLLRNLLENGAKHGQPPVQVVVSHHGNEALVVVSDHGPGIAPEERERVFEPFYRPAGRGEAGGGWGLGLSLVRQIAALHGGQVESDAEAGGGSRFVVRLATGGTSRIAAQLEP